ncbi:MAG: elongation factor P [Candidatus Omnitrophota bacterium]|nr:elongation factor P [Candidatus Omnitrophota bacterium]
MIKAGQLRQGAVIVYSGQLHEVIEAKHNKPGKGGAFIKAKLRNLASGSIISETMRPEDTMEQVFIEQKQMQFLYKDDMGYCLMDEVSYEQLHVSEEKIGENADYIKEGMFVNVKVYDGKIMSVEPPIHVILEVTHTEPGMKGDTVSGATKPATLETGKIVKVPLFVEQHQKIKVDTRTGEYIERA